MWKTSVSGGSVGDATEQMREAMEQFQGNGAVLVCRTFNAAGDRLFSQVDSFACWGGLEEVIAKLVDQAQEALHDPRAERMSLAILNFCSAPGSAQFPATSLRFTVPGDALEWVRRIGPAGGHAWLFLNCVRVSAEDESRMLL